MPYAEIPDSHQCKFRQVDIPSTFRSYQLEQSLLLPPDVKDWLPEGHLAYHVSDLVDALDLVSIAQRLETAKLEAG